MRQSQRGLEYDEGMAKLKFSVMASALTDDLRDAPRRSRAAGFEGIVFDGYSPRLNLVELSASGRRDFRHLLAAQNQQLAALAVDFQPQTDLRLGRLSINGCASHECPPTGAPRLNPRARSSPRPSRV